MTNESEIKKQIERILRIMNGEVSGDYNIPGTGKIRNTVLLSAVDQLLTLFEQYANQARKEWYKRAEDTPYTKAWIAKQLGISRPTLNKLLKDPESFTISMVKKLIALSSHSEGDSE